jgi:galactofuranose transport system permease protein
MGTVRDRLGSVGVACSSTEGAGSMLESLAGVLLFYTIPNVISQVGTLTSYPQQVVTGLF